MLRKYTIRVIKLTWRGDGVLGFGVGIRSDSDDDDDGIGEGSLTGVGVRGGGLGLGAELDDEELDGDEIGTGDGSLGNGATSFGRKYVGSNRSFLLLQQLKHGYRFTENSFKISNCMLSCSMFHTV